MVNDCIVHNRKQFTNIQEKLKTETRTHAGKFGLGRSGAVLFGTPGATRIGCNGWSRGLLGKGGTTRCRAGLGGRLEKKKVHFYFFWVLFNHEQPE